MYRVLAQDKPLRRALLLAGVLAGLVLAASASAWALTYSFTTIDVPGSIATIAYGINQSGEVVGDYFDTNTHSHGLLVSGGGFSTFDVPGALNTVVTGINAAGDIVGISEEAAGPTHSFLFSDGSFSLLYVPGSIRTDAFDINEAGQVVGSYTDAERGGSHGFLFSNGSYTTLDVPGSIATGAFGINEAGQVVGTYANAPTGPNHGFLFSNGSYTTLDVPGSSSTIAQDINQAGQVVGSYNTLAGPSHGFLFSNGSYTTLDVPGSFNTDAYGINDVGQVVGSYNEPEGPTRGFIATPIATLPPVVTITATPKTLWPPNGKMVPVSVSGTITDNEPGGTGVDAGTASFEVKDEYGSVQPSGDITLDANGNYTFTIQLQASRHGNDRDGRQYTITVRALDTAGNEGSAATSVIVPHDQGPSIVAR
jgi:probable HAF family extracellular repeat protein